MAGSPGDAPLVGRERELAFLRSVVAGAAAGEARAVLVAGQAGIGKTRLVHALLEEPHPLVLRAQCVDLGDPGLPYLAMTDLVRAVRAAADADPEVASVLAGLPLVAALSDPGAAVPDEGAVDQSRRWQLFDGVATLLASVGRVRGPVVVVVEDLQWVDASSSDFLRFLLSRMASERLAVVATVRTEGLAAAPRVRRLLAELGRLPSVRRLDLDPLDAEQVSALLAGTHGGPVDPDVAAEVLRRTGGNPYYVQVLAAGLDTSGGLDAGTPRALADLLVGRLDGLPDTVRTVVSAASVVAHPVPDRLLRQVVALPDEVADEAVRVAVAEGLLRPEGTAYAFVHDLLRSAVHDHLLPGERARLHAAHAAALRAGAAGVAAPAEVAHHYAEAQDRAELLVWSVRAAEAAMQVWAAGEALQHLERALAEWPGVDSAASLVGASEGSVATRAARAAGLAGEPSRALAWARRAVALSAAGDDVPARVRAHARLAHELVASDAGDQSVAAAREAVALVEAGEAGDRTAAVAHESLARALLAARRPEEARPYAERALAEARAARLPGLEVEVLAILAFVHEITGDREQAADLLGVAVRLARVERELAAELRAHYSLASLHYYGGDVAGSLPVLREALTRVEESGLRWSDSGIELRLLNAIALYVTGDLDRSMAAAETADTRSPDVPAARLAAVGCYAAVARGLPRVAGQLDRLRASWELDPQVGLVAGGCEAEHLAWQGDFAGAVEVAERAQVHLDTVAGEGMYGGLWLSALALGALADSAAVCRLRRDDAGAAAAVEQGEVILRRVERIAEGGHGRPGDLGPEGRAWHARAVAEHARLLGAPAVEEWRAALAAFGYGHAYEQARCHWRLAEALVRTSDRDGARTHAHAAAAAAERMGARPLERAVAATVGRARLDGPAATDGVVLTAREREVLGLVAEGLTNREIGKRLFISEKTASVHLSNAMAKLNASSRTEAVTVAHRRGLLDVLGTDGPPR